MTVTTTAKNRYYPFGQARFAHYRTGLPGCPPKLAYFTRAAADAVCDALREESPTIRSYLCPCGEWHVGRLGAPRWWQDTAHVERHPELLIEIGPRALHHYLGAPARRNKQPWRRLDAA